MNKIVVTGSTSMIGCAIIEELIKHDEVKRIYAVVREGCTKLDRIPNSKKVKIVQCNLDSYCKLVSLINEYDLDVFFSVAWDGTGQGRNNDILVQSMNITSTLYALRASKQLGCKKFIGVGSQAEYGLLDVDRISPNSPTNPIQAYGICKLAACNLAKQEAQKLGIDFFWVRVFSVFGKNDRSTTLISTLLQKMRSNEPVAITKAEQVWDYLYVEDAARAFYLIAKKSIGSKIYCLGSGESKPLKDYIEDIKSIVNPQAELRYGAIPYSTNTIMHLCADITLLNEDTGFTPFFSFKDAIIKMNQE